MRLNAQASVVVVIDIQARLAPAIEGAAVMNGRAHNLLRAASILDVPVAFTEHYPKGLGHTLLHLREAAPAAPVFEKIHFDACREPGGLLAHLTSLGRQQVVILGCEAHVCVMQTALGLVAAGYEVALAGDATGSRRADDKAAAIDRMT